MNCGIELARLKKAERRAATEMTAVLPGEPA
jgi:hypothetical protein